MIRHARHQTQNAARLLETFNRRPLVIEEMKKFRMNRIAIHHLLLIRNILCLHGKIIAMRAVHLTESRTNGIACRLVLARKKKSAPHDFKAFVCRHRLPDGLHAPEGMLDLRQNLLPCIAANFDFRFRQGCDHHTATAGTSRLGKLLDERDEIVERAGRKPLYPIEFLGIGDKLVHEDEACAAFIEHIAQRFRSGRNAALVRFLHIVVQLGIFRCVGKLGGNLAP